MEISILEMNLESALKTDGEGQYSNENGQVNGYLLLPLHQMKIKTKIWNIHM